MTDEAISIALARSDELYTQPNGESALPQLQIQLANPIPYDLEGVALGEYKNPAPRRHDWQVVKRACVRMAILIFDKAAGRAVQPKVNPSWLAIGVTSHRGQCLTFHLAQAVERLRHDQDLPLAAPALRAHIPLPRI